jgi:hypothetical protein
MSGASTTFTLTVSDLSGQVWKNGSITYQFLPNPTYSGIYNWGGTPLPLNYRFPTTISLNSSGYGTFTVPSSTDIAPANSAWSITVTPNASFPSFVFAIPAVGTTEDISTIVNAAINIVGIGGAYFPRAYNDNEVKVIPGQGAYYYNTSTKSTRVWDGSSWSDLTTASNLVLTVPLTTTPYGSGFSVIANNASPSDIYNTIYTAGKPYDVIVGAIVIPSTAIQYQVDAVAGYVENHCTVSNAVALFGQALHKVTGGSSWGQDVVFADTATTAATVGYAQELDTQPFGPASSYPQDYSLMGSFNSLFAPQAGLFGSAFVAARGEVGQWKLAFNSFAGAAFVGLKLSYQSATVFPSDSQYINLVANDGTAEQSSIIQTIATTKGLRLTPPTGGNVEINGGSLVVVTGNGSVTAPLINASSVDQTACGITSGVSSTTITGNKFAFKSYIFGSTAARWSASYYSEYGASYYGMWFGANASAPSSDGQIIRMDSINSSGTTLNAFLQLDRNGVFNLSGALSYNFQGSAPITTNSTINASGYSITGTPGISTTVALAKLTTSGTNGSLTFAGGLLISKVDPT